MINKELYPFKNNYFQIKNLKMHYLDEGSGEPVLMLHGNPTWSFFFRDMIRELSESYRCIVPDHIGNGLSDKPSKKDYSYTLAERSENLEALLDSLAITENITLVVHDWGGFLGFHWAMKNREKIKKIVILNSSAFGVPPGRRFPWLVGLAKNNILGPLLVQGLNAFCIGSNLLCTVKKMPIDVQKMYLEPYDSWEHRFGVLAFVQDVPLKPEHVSYKTLQETAEGLKCFADTPKIICWADRDFIFDKHFLKVWTDTYPDAPVHHFEKAGHYILEDAGAEVTAVVKDFLDRKT